MALKISDLNVKFLHRFTVRHRGELTRLRNFQDLARLHQVHIFFMNASGFVRKATNVCSNVAPSGLTLRAIRKSVRPA